MTESHYVTVECDDCHQIIRLDKRLTGTERVTCGCPHSRWSLQKQVKNHALRVSGYDPDNRESWASRKDRP